MVAMVDCGVAAAAADAGAASTTTTHGAPAPEPDDVVAAAAVVGDVMLHRTIDIAAPMRGPTERMQLVVVVCTIVIDVRVWGLCVSLCLVVGSCDASGAVAEQFQALNAAAAS